MTRRLFATVTLAVCVVGGIGALASPAAAEGSICIGGDNQRKPGYNQGICLVDNDTIRLGG